MPLTIEYILFKSCFLLICLVLWSGCQSNEQQVDTNTEGRALYLYENNSMEDFLAAIKMERSELNEEEIQYIFYKASSIYPELMDSISNPEFKLYGKVVEEKEIQKDPSRADAILDEQVIMDTSNFIERKRLKMKISNSFHDGDIEFLKSTNHNFLSPLELHQYIHLILTSSVVFSHKVQTKLAYASIDYALSLLHNDLRAQKFKSLKAQAWTMKGKYFIEEVGFQETIDECISKARKLYAETSKYDECTYLDLFFGDINNHEFKDVIDEIQSLSINQYRKEILILHLGFKWMGINSNEANLFVKTYIDLQNERSSKSWLTHLAKVYLAHIEKSLGNPNEALDLLDEVRDDMMKTKTLQSRYYYIDGLLSLYPLLDRSLTADKKLSLLMEHRQVADSMFYGESEHLEDYYVMNMVQVLELFESKSIRETQTIIKVISLMEETKKREINRFRNLKEEEEILDKSSIKKLLLEVNDFKNLDYQNKELRKEVYQILLQNYHVSLNIKDFEISNQGLMEEGFDLSKLSDSIELINLIYLDDFYYGYLLNDKELQTFKFESIYVDSLENVVLDNLPKYREINQIGLMKDYLIKEIGLDPRKQIYFLLDGELSHFPIHLIFPKARRSTSINDFLLNQPNDVNFNAIALFSYSGPKKNSTSVDPLELPYSYEECSSVANILGSHDYQFYFGSTAKKENLISCFNSEIVHLSTHGMSLSNNRYNNYLIAHGQTKNSTTKFYSYELDSININSKFVFLSACDSGLGKNLIGSGTYSMANALLRNKVNTVIYTLWKVNDQVALEFSKEFYSSWSSGLTAEAAIERTRSIFNLNKSYSKYDWGGFVLEGNGKLRVN